MNITRLTQKLLKPAFTHTNFLTKRTPLSFSYSHTKPNNSMHKTTSLTSKQIFTFSNDKEPKKNNKNENTWKEKFQEKVKLLNTRFDQFYRAKLSVKVIALSLFASAILALLAADNQSQEISIQEFVNLVETNGFKQVIFVEEEFFYSKKLRAKKVQGRINNQVFFAYVNSFDQFYEKILKYGDIKFTNQKRYGFEFLLQKSYILFDIVNLVIIVGILLASRKSGAGGMGQMNMMKQKKFEVTKNVTVRFKDVAGLHEVKREVQEIVDFLKNPDKYTSLGASIPKGVLLTGPPGTGKTLLAKACAGQAQVPFYSVSGSDFVEMYVGVGASRVRQLFNQAKNSDKAAIIFIDELDAIGKKRMNKLGGNDQRQSTLNQLLVQMDGFGTSNKVIIMGATNRKQILDNALVRPGRFDRQVQVGLPDLKGRFEIFLVHLKPLKLSSKYAIEEYGRRLASLTPGFSGAQIANLCNQAAILSARHGKQVVEMIDFELSSERVIGGVQRKGFVSLEEKKTVAYHECGHAVVSWFLQGADPLLKVTIIPRSKGALGFAQYFLNQNQLQTKQEMLDRVCFILGGRCAQQHFFGEVTTGAYDDLSKAYDVIYSMIAKYGMDTNIGYISFPDSQYTRPFGQDTAAKIDAEIRKIIKQCTVKTKNMIIKHQTDIKRLAEQLLVKETLDVRAIQRILGQRPFPPNKTFQQYLETSSSPI